MTSGSSDSTKDARIEAVAVELYEYGHGSITSWDDNGTAGAFMRAVHAEHRQRAKGILAAADAVDPWRARAVAAEAQLAETKAELVVRGKRQAPLVDVIAAALCDQEETAAVEGNETWWSKSTDEIAAFLATAVFANWDPPERVTLDKIREWRQGVIDHCSAERIDPPAWCASLAALLDERQP